MNVIILLLVILIVTLSLNNAKSSKKSSKNTIIKPKSKKVKVEQNNDNKEDIIDEGLAEYDIVHPINDNEAPPISSNSLLKNTFDITKKVVSAITKTSRKVAKTTVDLCVVKHIKQEEIYGKWLMRQEVEVRKGIFVSCPATILFKEDDNSSGGGVVSTVFEGHEHKFKFKFTER